MNDGQPSVPQQQTPQQQTPQQQTPQQQAPQQANAWDRLKARLFENKFILYSFLVFVVAMTLIGLMNSVTGVVGFIQERAEKHPSARFKASAFNLGNDIFPAAWGATFAEERNSPEVDQVVHKINSRIRANLTTLGLNVKFPPAGKPSADKFVAVLSEEIRPKLANKDNELVDWYDYGYYWGEKSMGLELIKVFTSPKALGGKPINREALSQILLTVKSNLATAEPLEERLNLKRRLVTRARQVRQHVSQLRDVSDTVAIQAATKEIGAYTNEVKQYIGK